MRCRQCRPPPRPAASARVGPCSQSKGRPPRRPRRVMKISRVSGVAAWRRPKHGPPGPPQARPSSAEPLQPDGARGLLCSAGTRRPRAWRIIYFRLPAATPAAGRAGRGGQGGQPFTAPGLPHPSPPAPPTWRPHGLTASSAPSNDLFSGLVHHGATCLRPRAALRAAMSWLVAAARPRRLRATTSGLLPRTLLRGGSRGGRYPVDRADPPSRTTSPAPPRPVQVAATQTCDTGSVKKRSRRKRTALPCGSRYRHTDGRHASAQQSPTSSEVQVT